MSHRGARVTDFEERDYYAAPPRRSAADFDEVEYRASRVLTRSPPPRPRSRSHVRESRGTAFLREDVRRTEGGPMVLRQRDVEVVDRHRRSPSPARLREDRILSRPRSVSPSTVREEHERVKFVERERVRSPSLVRRSEPEPRPVRFVERRPRSPSPTTREHIRTRIVERETERSPSTSPSPSPPPIIRGPTIERDVITHYTDVDHGVVRLEPSSPAPVSRPRARERETDIDISLSKHRTDVDIRQSSGRARSKSRERRWRHRDDDVFVDGGDLARLRVDDRTRSSRRARSAAPLHSAVDDEADYITEAVDSRGRPGEAWAGATKDWTIVDVPPGTERVRMDGVGGGGTDTTWSRYSGVRRTKFVPERDEFRIARQPSPLPARERSSRTSVAVYDHDREIDVDIERRVVRRPEPPPPPPKEMWTEMTKDLVTREAIEQMGYEYEETKWFYYIMSYLPYDEVLHLIELSDGIRRARRERARELRWEHDWRDDWGRPHHRHRHDHRRLHDGWDDERVRETEVIYDSHRPRFAR